MNFEDRIRLVVEAVTGNATRNLEQVRGELQKTEGPAGRARGAIAGVGDTIRNNLGLTLAGGATAIAGFALSAVRSFQTTALEADKLAAATGLTIDQASRWREVVGDLGLNTDLLAGAVNRLNTADAKGKLAELGIEGDGTNDRLIKVLEYLQAITDETRRSQEATALLGRSWTELAPLVDTADTLRDSLAAVSDAKVIDPEEREKARRLRDALDNLNEVSEALALTLGEGLAPALADIADWLATLTEKYNQLPPIFRTSLPQYLKDFVASFPGGSGDMKQTPEDLMKKYLGIGGGPPSMWDENYDWSGVDTRGRVTINNTTVTYPPGTDPRATNSQLQDYWRQNGTR